MNHRRKELRGRSASEPPVSAGNHEPRRPDDLLEQWARMSDISPPVPPTRRRSPGLGPLLGLALVAVLAAVSVRAWQSMGGTPAANSSPSASTLGGGSSAAASPSPTPIPSPSPTAEPASSDDAATARLVATQFETARASGDWATAWSMLAPYSQAVIGSLAAFEELERAYNAAGGSTFTIQDPTRDPDLLNPEFLGQAYLDAAATADMDRAWLVFVDHPKVRGASAASIGLLVAPIDGRWSVWIAH